MSGIISNSCIVYCNVPIKAEAMTDQNNTDSGRSLIEQIIASSMYGVCREPIHQLFLCFVQQFIHHIEQIMLLYHKRGERIPRIVNKVEMKAAAILADMADPARGNHPAIVCALDIVSV
jgi:hypothetical protein